MAIEFAEALPGALGSRREFQGAPGAIAAKIGGVIGRRRSQKRSLAVSKRRKASSGWNAGISSRSSAIADEPFRICESSGILDDCVPPRARDARFPAFRPLPLLPVSAAEQGESLPVLSLILRIRCRQPPYCHHDAFLGRKGRGAGDSPCYQGKTGSRGQNPVPGDSARRRRRTRHRQVFLLSAVDRFDPTASCFRSRSSGRGGWGGRSVSRRSARCRAERMD